MLSVLHHSSPDGSLRSLISYKEGVTETYPRKEKRSEDMDENRIIKVQFLEVIIVFHPNLTTLILFSSRYGAHLRPEVMMMKEK